MPRPRSFIMSLLLAFLFPLAVSTPAWPQEGTPIPGANVWSPTERTIDLNGISTRIIEVGDLAAAETVVLVHGGPGVSSDVLRGLFALAGPDLRVVTYDQRGTGGTAQPADDDYGLTALSDDLDALRAALGVNQIHLIGHSWGGLLAAFYTASHPTRVSSLTLNGPVPLAPDRESLDEGYATFNTRVRALQQEGLIPDPLPPIDGEDCSAFVDAILPAYLDDPQETTPRFREELPKATCNWMVNRTTSDEAWAFMPSEAYQAQREAAEKWPGSLFVVFGESDPFSAPWAELTASPFTNAQRMTEITLQAGHYPWIDDPMFIDRLREFIFAGAKE